MTALAERRDGEPVWLELTTTDFDSSLAFYGGLFDWTPDGSAQLDGSRTLLLGGAQVARLVPAPEDGWIVYLKVADAGSATAAVLERGGAVQVGAAPVADLGVMTIATDPGGARVGFWEAWEHAGFGVDATPGAPAWFELHTKDFATAVPFYRHVAGWRPVSVGDSDGFRMVVHGDPGSARAGIFDASREDLDEASVWVPYFAVADTDATAARIRELGGALLEEPVDTPYGRMARATDPVGTLFTIIRLATRS